MFMINTNHVCRAFTFFLHFHLLFNVYLVDSSKYDVVIKVSHGIDNNQETTNFALEPLNFEKNAVKRAIFGKVVLAKITDKVLVQYLDLFRDWRQQ